jgi:hypothetical protein
MQRHFFVTMVCMLGAVALALPLSVRALLTNAARRAPESLAEAVEVAEDLGLYHRYDGPSAGARCVVVSEMELPHTPGQNQRMNNPSHPFWIGTVAIYGDARMMLINYNPSCSVVWGTLFVYGDPDLIEKLTGRRP